VNTAAKEGSYQRVVTDLSLVLGGHAVNITRAYNSLHSSLGADWRFVSREFDVQTSVPATGRESLGSFHPYRAGTRLYLTLPDGRRVGFMFTPEMHEISGLQFFTPAYTPDAGVDWTLDSVAANLIRGGSNFFDLETGRPYNPLSSEFGDHSFTLTAPGGMMYRLNHNLLLSEQLLPDGFKLIYSDSGILAPNGDSARFTYDGAGRLISVDAFDGSRVVYSYDELGRLVSARNLSTVQSSAYGYSAENPHRLVLIAGLLDSADPGTFIDYPAAGASLLTPREIPLTADLGVANRFLLTAMPGNLAPGAIDRYAFTIRSSEIASVADGMILLGVQVTADAGSALLPAIPEIPGMTPLAAQRSGGSAFALFAISRASLQLLEIGGADSSASGAYTVQLFVPGDVNLDGKVDGLDGQLLTPALGSRTGDANYRIAADGNRDGVIDAADAQLLARALGFAANLPPVVNSVSVLTHVDLEHGFDPATLGIDPEDDPLVFRALNARNGIVRQSADGQVVLFSPSAGFNGAASFDVIADDGFASSAPATVAVNVSAAPLLRIDFAQRNPRLTGGQTVRLELIGDFADQTGVTLPPSYLTFTSTVPEVAATTPQGLVTAVGDGTAVLIATRDAILAATAVGVG
jgi:YD repeat-containing protein